MAEADEKQKRAQMTRVEILRAAQSDECFCEGKWKECADKILRRNEIPEGTFCKAVFNLLEKGRGKYRNVMIIGPAHCGKTFILNPLNKIYNTFSNPATGSFAWIGAAEAEVLFLNDFRWTASIIPWHDFLLMLEGQIVHLPAPKTHYTRDLVLEKETPVFATSNTQLVYVRGGEVDEKESEMRAVRWRLFHFFYQIPPHDQIEIPPCPFCFSHFILQNSGN